MKSQQSPLDQYLSSYQIIKKCVWNNVFKKHLQREYLSNPVFRRNIALVFHQLNANGWFFHALSDIYTLESQVWMDGSQNMTWRGVCDGADYIRVKEETWRRVGLICQRHCIIASEHALKMWHSMTIAVQNARGQVTSQAEKTLNGQSHLGKWPIRQGEIERV